MKKQNLIRQNLSLAIPIMLSSLGQNFVQMVDTLMVGKLSTNALAGISFAGALTSNLYIGAMGLAMGLTPLVGQAYAVKNNKKIHSLFCNSLSLNLLTGVFICCFLLALTPFLHLFGQDAEVIRICKPYYIIIAFSLIPGMLFLGFKQFMEGVDNTKVAMIITLSTNVLNIILNYIFIFGKFGCPAMGLFGAGLSTFIARLLSPIAFYLYILYDKKYRYYLKPFSFKDLSLNIHKRLLRIGSPIAGQIFVEMFALFAMTMMMGWISATHMAAFQIVNTLIATTFCAANGISAATTILISHAYGLKDRILMRKLFFLGWKLVLCIMSCFVMMYFFLGRYIAMGFSSDIEVINIATELFIVAGIFQIFDGTQIAGLAGLRAINDVIPPFFYACIAYLIFAVGFAFTCGFILKLGAASIFASFIFGLIFAGFMYHRRFLIKTRAK